jgi:cytochrome c553
MKRIVLTVIVLLPFIVGLGAQPQQTGADPEWAFPVINGALPDDEEGPFSVPGSELTFTEAQIDDLYAPPDWFPNEHAPAPQIVKYGHGDALGCGACHLMSGFGHPESADLTGFTPEYILQQLADFKTRDRIDSSRMNGIVQALSDQEMREAAEWFSGLETGVWAEVIETETVPETFVGGGRMRFAVPDGGTEPIGNRVITLPMDQDRATKRDPHSGFIAYVPPGSIARGEEIVMNGDDGRTVQCTLCHGETLHGLGNVPRLAGLTPIYVARQLYLFKGERRNGVDAQLMKGPVEDLTDEDIVAISAYLGSLDPSE